MKQNGNRNTKDKYLSKVSSISYEKAFQLGTLNLSQFSENYEEAARYYFQQAKYLYLQNIEMKSKVDKLILDHTSIKSELLKLQAINPTNKNSEQGHHTEEKKRRKRRNASEIQRLYKCPAKACEKSYGSQGTLAQHLKLKHPETDFPLFNQRQDDKTPIGQTSKVPSKEEINESYTCKQQQPDS